MIKRIQAVMAALLLLPALAGCAPDTPAPAQEDETAAIRRDFDLQEAYAILLETEAAVALLSLQLSYPVEAQQLVKDAYGNSASIVWDSFFITGIDSSEFDTFEMRRGVFFPLLYHTGIEIEDAYLETVELSDGSRVEQLVIREYYMGDDTLLSDFLRENLYRQNAVGAWEFHEFRGDIAVLDDLVDPAYLFLERWE